MTRTEWFLGGLLVVLLVIVAGMAAVLWLRPDNNVPPAVTTQPVVNLPVLDSTALVASTFAQQVAQGWQADARLYQASSTVPQASLGQLQTGTGAWNFTFYSPGQTAVATIDVVNNQANLLSDNPSQNRLAPLEVSGWKLNSPEAITIMLQQGGEAFMRQESAATLIMTLTTDNGNGRIEWFISLFAEQSGNSFTTRLDATSGEVLEIIQAPTP